MVKHVVCIVVLALMGAGAAAAAAPSPYQHSGPLLTNGGVSFRVWAPTATTVNLAGPFNGWSSTADSLAPDDSGSNTWSIFKPGVGDGTQYKFVVDGSLWRVDPWAREIDYSGGNANTVVRSPERVWSDFTRPHKSETVIYELHVGTFDDGTFAGVAARAEYLQRMGVNTVLVMPPAEFGGDRSWGYNPVGVYAPESTYGAYGAFRDMVDVLHAHGIAVHVDVVYNHVEGDVLWKWDGWSKGFHTSTIDGQSGEHGGIFYYDWMGTPPERWYTPWGKNRPNFSRPEVTNYFTENLVFWLDEMNCDGIRMDSTITIRKVQGSDIVESYPFLRTMNAAADAREPDAIVVAEDLQRWDGVTRKDGTGLGFDAQWDDYFVDTVRGAMIAASDGDRDMNALANTVRGTDEGRAFARVKYTESHDEAANGNSRLNVEIDGPDGTSFFAKRRSMLGAALALTAPGIPMLFQGQELLEDGYFSDEDPLDWSKLSTFGGINRFYRDLIHLRRNADGISGGLTGVSVNVYYVDNSQKLMAYHRYQYGGTNDDIVVLVNASASARTGKAIGLPHGGTWHCLLNSDWRCYDGGFTHVGRDTVTASAAPLHGLNYRGTFDLPAYAVHVYGRSSARAPVADFSVAPSNGVTGVRVSFEDLTVGTGTNWHWEFGDGTQSRAVNPRHTYDTGGVFTVSLTVAGPNGLSRKTLTNAITVWSPPSWVDGLNLTTDLHDYDAAGFQDTVSGWGEWNSLLALRGRLTDERLELGISGSVEPSSGNGIVLLIDVDQLSGVSTMPGGLNNVAFRLSNLAGLRCDPEFTPDYGLAVGLQAGPTPTKAWVDFSDLNADANSYWGTLDDLGSGPGYLSNAQAEVALYNVAPAGTSLAPTGTYDTGLEVSLSRDALGGVDDICWVQALLINADGSWTANQSLAPIGGDSNTYAQGGPSAQKRYDLVTGRQYVMVVVPEPAFLLPAAVLLTWWRFRAGPSCGRG